MIGVESFIGCLVKENKKILGLTGQVNMVKS